MDDIEHCNEVADGIRASQKARDPYSLPYGHPMRRDEAEDMETLREQLASAENALNEFRDGLTEALDAHGVPSMPSWREAIDWLAVNGGR